MDYVRCDLTRPWRELVMEPDPTIPEAQVAQAYDMPTEPKMVGSVIKGEDCSNKVRSAPTRLITPSSRTSQTPNGLPHIKDQAVTYWEPPYATITHYFPVFPRHSIETSPIVRKKEEAINRVLRKIAEDFALSPNLFNDNTAFLTDLGVDSLLMMVIVDRVDKAQGAQMPFWLFGSGQCSIRCLEENLAQYVRFGNSPETSLT